MALKDMHLNCRGIIKIENEIWFSNLEFNGLFKLDLHNFTVKFIHQFTSSSATALGLHAKQVFHYEEYLVFLPCSSNKVVLYNMQTNRDACIEIPGYRNKDFYTMYAKKIGEIVWLFPSFLANGVYILDLDTKNIEKDYNTSKLFQDIPETCVVAITEFEDKLFFTITEENRLLELNLNDKKAHWSYIPEEVSNILEIAFDGEYYWGISKDSSNVYKWNRGTGILTRYELEDTQQGSVPGNFPYYHILIIDGNVILIGYKYRHVMRINQQTGKIELLFEYPEKFRFIENRLNGWPAFETFMTEDRKLWFFPGLGNMLLIYDMDTKTIEAIDFKIEAKEVFYYVREREEELASGNLIRETEEIGNLEWYINNLPFKICEMQDGGLCGEKIFSRIKKGILAW